MSPPLWIVAVCAVWCWVAAARPDAKLLADGQHRVHGEWHATSWEPCEPEKVFQTLNETEQWIVPMVGVQRRTLTCISANASVLPPSWCSDYATPLHQRRCVVPQSCRLADWSPWETHQHGCRGDDDQVVPEVRVRRRRIVQALLVVYPSATAAAASSECRPWQEKRIVDEPSQLPLCNQRYKWQPSPWSACRANGAKSPAGLSSKTSLNDAFQPICGGGVQMRSLTCLRLSDSRPVNSKLCRALTILPIIQHCEIPCDSDCQVSEWSSWSPCAAARCVTASGASGPAPTSTAYVREGDDAAADDDADVYQPKNGPTTGAGGAVTDESDGYQFRQRRIVSNASADGTECPALSQMRRCRTDWRDACTRWQVRPLLDTCHLADNATCGLGYRELVFRCRRYDGVTVDDEQCSHTTLPPLEQVSCAVHCPSDCVLSQWSEWTACLHQGRRRRTRYVVGLPLPGGEPCPVADQLMEEELCSSEQQELERLGRPAYNWWPLPWAPCRLSAPGSVCGSGTHAREVRCTRDDGEHVDDDHCRLLVPKPDSVRPCSIACPEECRLSDWSEWSQCSDQSPEDAIQSRIRVVLQQPGSSGSSASSSASSSSSSSSSFQFPCPPLVEKRSCFDWLAQQERIGWHLGDWTACHLQPGAKCGVGIAVRSAACRDGNNATIDPSVCLSKLMDEYRRLELVRECRVPCGPSEKSNCTPVTSSLPFPAASGACPRNCIGMRSVHGSDCDGPAADEEDCPCERITLELEDWSTCVLDDHLRSCGRGRRYRRRKCVVTATGQLAPLHWCNEEDYEVRSCEIPCPVDCQLSAWSSWTTCNATCGPGAQRRTRKIEVEPLDGGRPCGSMEEVQPCRVRPCDAYRWRSSDWTPCHSADAARCGRGLQTRYVRCVDVAEDVVVDDAVCDSSTKPAAEQSCRIACPGECVVSDWSPWSPCHDCQSERKRERSIIRNPVYNHTCPQLEQVESCSVSSGDGSLPASQFCFGYQWQVSEWSSCLPLGGSNCGEGVRTRLASCVRTDGYVVDSRHCDPHTKPSLTEMWCHVECPIDCQISAWSAWDDSECAPCGHHSGLRSRHREILMINNQYGRACPSTLRQQLPCPYRPCYEWRPSNWSHCHLEGAQCGTGRRLRLSDCVLADSGKRVDPEFCLLAGRRSNVETAECKVLCTFEKLVKSSSIDELAASIQDGVSTLLPVAEHEISVSYYPTDGEFNIWMVAMIAIGSLFLVFVGVTIFLICSSREEANCKRQMSVAGPSHEFRTANRVLHRVSNASH